VRILQVIHQFPPYSSQGSEVYCYNLSSQLAKTEDVRVFHVANGKRRWFPRRLDRESYNGLKIYHSVDGAEYSRVATWPNLCLRGHFQQALAEFRPQIVHFHNFLSLGDDLVSIAHLSGAHVVYTLHDYGLICPNTLLLREDRKLCLKNDSEFFQDCCPTLIRSSRWHHVTAPWLSRLPSLARWRLYSEQHPNRTLRFFLLTGVQMAERFLGHPRTMRAGVKRDFFQVHTRRIFRDVDLFLAPSEFLLRRYVSCGLPAHKTVHTKYGMCVYPRKLRKDTSLPVRFGYIGALHAHKGVDLLLEAFNELKAGATLSIYGSVFGSPVSQNYWQRVQAAQPSNIAFRGAYKNHDVGAILSEIDVIIVPSVWYENSPLTIQEAFMAGVPVITADQGGMAEAVRNGVDGLHFRLGDAADLREKMRRLIDHPELVDQLRRGIPKVTNIEPHAAELRIRYGELLQPSYPNGSRQCCAP
jgi:glycosyltransferase involved in cell wall biosynthesis